MPNTVSGEPQNAKTATSLSFGRNMKDRLGHWNDTCFKENFSFEKRCGADRFV